MNLISEKTRKFDRKYELLEEPGELLRDLNTYFPKLMNYLWEQPKIVTSVIQNCDKNNLKEYLAPFFVNNFYENILSSKFIEDNLIYVITLLLKDEINGLNNINQDEKFLSETSCGIILEELRRKNDIQAFFKSIIVNSIDNLEVNYSSYRFTFEIKKLTEEYRQQSMCIKNQTNPEVGYLKYAAENMISSESWSLDDGNNTNRNRKKSQIEQEHFNQNYIPFLDKDALQKLVEENKHNKKMYDYCYSKMHNCTINKDIYSNKKLMEKLYRNEFSQELLLQYQNNFTAVINFIDSIIDNLLNNFHLLPYSVKCLCKIISMLVTKKFPSINETEKNSFISKFFFGKLLIPILKNPGIEAFISDFIISGNTLYNLEMISEIIIKLTSGKFYCSDKEYSDFTPYNWYFIKKMEKLFNIFENITKVRLPTFIERLINNLLPANYEFDYFVENPDEVIYHRSICFNLEQVKALLVTMDKSKDKIFSNKQSPGLKKTVEKLLSRTNQELLEELLYRKRDSKIIQPITFKKKDTLEKEKEKEKDKEEDRPKLYYFLITTLLTNAHYKDLFNIEQAQTKSFSLPELKQIQNDEDDMKNNIIKVKNFFCSLLYNYNKFIKTDFDEGTTENTTKILKEINIFMKSSNFVVDGSIPSDWYVKSLLEYLEKIPKDLTVNDCEKLYDEIENDVNKSIKNLDFEALSVIFGKLQFVKRGTIYYEECKKLLNDIKLNEETKTIIENELIPVEVRFNLDESEEDGIFEITPKIIKLKEKLNLEKIKEYEKSKKIKVCMTIQDFTNKFPDIVKYQELQDADVFEIQRNLNFPKKINSYLNLVKKSLEKRYTDVLPLISEKIYDYVMSKIYDKIYPSEPYEEDNKIFQQSIRLAWTEPKHFIKRKKKLVFGSFLTDVIKNFNFIDTEKSPRKKLLYMKEIFSSIGFLLKFNGVGLDAGVDDQLPILNYAFVKAHPLRMFSNAKFMELYIGEKRNKFEGSQLTQLLSICDFIIQITYQKLIDVTNDEFIKKCNEATLDTSIKIN